MSHRKVLVTGGAGYIGSHLVDALVECEYEITVLDNLEPQVHPSGKLPDYANKKVKYIKGDVTHRKTLSPLVKKTDIVVHFAAAVGLGQSMYQINRYVDVNTHGTALLLDILANEKHRVEKLIVASSVGVYGEGAYTCKNCGISYPTLRSPEQLAVKDWEPRCRRCGLSLTPIATKEEKPLYCDNIYSMTKRHQEEMALLIGKTYGIPTVAPRFFNVYGPRQSLSNPYAGVAAIFISRLLNDKPPVIFEDGGQLRDFVSIHDVVEALILFIERSKADYLPVNLGSGQKISILSLAQTLAQLLGKSIAPQILKIGRKFDIRHCFADITRAQETVGYTPKVPLEEGMAELIEWAKTHSDLAVDYLENALSELKKKDLLI